jgi:cyclopropane fatty-acyl-phospholipid synthase-like methyltransferase
VESRRPVSDLSTESSPELVEAVESGWFPPSSSVMDIGSGRGHISAWLAERGFEVMGADFAPEATRLARKHFEGVSDRLTFRTLDICADSPEPARFDALFDRGCYHSIPRETKPRYARNAATWAKEGARFLLLSKVARSESELIEEVRELFGPYFDVVRTEPTFLTRSTGPIPRIRLPAIAFWMVRWASDRPVVQR